MGVKGSPKGRKEVQNRSKKKPNKKKPKMGLKRSRYWSEKTIVSKCCPNTTRAGKPLW
jgi:hypothetical protein